MWYDQFERQRYNTGRYGCVLGDAPDLSLFDVLPEVFFFRGIDLTFFDFFFSRRPFVFLAPDLLGNLLGLLTFLGGGTGTSIALGSLSAT